MPLYQVGKFFYVPGRLDKVKKPRMYATLGILAAVVAAVLFLPLPHSVMATLEVQPRDAAQVWVDVPGGGKLVAVYVKPGQRVTTGQPLALLENVELARGDRKTPRRAETVRGAIGKPAPRGLARPARRHPDPRGAEGPENRRRPTGPESARPAASPPQGARRRHGPAAAGHRGPRRSRGAVARLVRHAPGPAEPRRLSPRRPAQRKRDVLPDRRSRRSSRRTW